MTPDYAKIYQKIALGSTTGRKLFGRGLTYAEKILLGHLCELPAGGSQDLQRGVSNVDFYPDRVAMQDATAQMALLQFMLANMNEAAVPTTIHCDHLIRAHVGAEKDLQVSLEENAEVFNFLKSAAARYGLGFWAPGAGIIHQVVLENYAFPGGMMVGTDSHTPNAGGLGMVAIGVGGADAVDVMVGEAFNMPWPKLIGVHLTGKLQGWASPKDVILKLMSILTVKGGTGHIVEFFGPGCSTISCTGKATITNMGAEHGATTSVFPYDARMQAFLAATARSELAQLADAAAAHLQADSEVLAQPEKYFDQVVHIDLSALEPHVVGPHTPDLARPISALKAAVIKEQYPDDVRFALIGSCTNSSYEDIGRSAHVARQARKAGLKAAIPLMVTPGSNQIQQTIERDGQMQDLQAIGAEVLANACGPCIGQWQRDDLKRSEKNSILTSYNRNFPGRNDANFETMAFIASPELVVAMSLAGKLSFNPLADTLMGKNGPFKLEPPSSEELPSRGFLPDEYGFVPPLPVHERSKQRVMIYENSKRLQLLERFAAWEGEDLTNLRVLLKAKGKCTTDHISPAGKWLQFRGHLSNISFNMFVGARNAFYPSFVGAGINYITGTEGEMLAQIAAVYKQNNQGWVVFGDENYGEGSSREHAAMSPRFLGCRAVIARSFARIHEANLKKQGILALWLSDPQDYDKVLSDDRIHIRGLTSFHPGKPLRVELVHKNGNIDTIVVKHTYSERQIEWFKAGSALNCLAQTPQA